MSEMEKGKTKVGWSAVQLQFQNRIIIKLQDIITQYQHSCESAHSGMTLTNTLQN